jgi:hypothetical protein
VIALLYSNASGLAKAKVLSECIFHGRLLRCLALAPGELDTLSEQVFELADQRADADLSDAFDDRAGGDAGIGAVGRGNSGPPAGIDPWAVKSAPADAEHDDAEPSGADAPCPAAVRGEALIVIGIRQTVVAVE